MPQKENNYNSNLKKIAVMAATLVVVFGILFLTQKKSINSLSSTSLTKSTSDVGPDVMSNSSTPTAIPSNTVQGDSTSISSHSDYKDGNYSATGAYLSPGGNESISVNVTLKDGVISDSSVEGAARRGNAQEYQQDFISGYKPFVIGKSISSLNLSRVSGASLTPKGFNDAIEKIKSQAQS